MSTQAAAAIVYLRLDAENDPVFDPAAELTDINAVGQAILTRLKLFTGEWWANLNDGTPMFQDILGQRASQQGQQIMALALANRIAGTPYVSAVTDISIAFDPVKRGLQFRATAQTSFGTIPVSYTPGLGASLG